MYYLDTDSNRVTVASTNITHSTEAFPTTTHYIDYTVHVPTVQNEDPWAGRPIGIQFASIVEPDLVAGGYWDLDNVRLSASQAGAASLVPGWSDGKFALTLVGEVGAVYEILSSSNVTAPLVEWDSRATLTNAMGTLTFMDAETDGTSRFYQARQVP